MKKIVFLFASCFVALSAVAQTKNFIDQPYIEMRVQVDTLVAPDQLFLSILILEKDSKGRTSLEQSERQMATALKGIGIDLKEQLTVSDVSSNFRKYFLRKKDILKSKSYTLEVHSALMAGKALIALEKAGISNVQLERTAYKNMEDLKLTLKTKAVLKAKKQGEALLQPLGQQLGTALFISDMNTSTYYRGRSAGIEMKYAADQSSEQPIDIAFKKMKVQGDLSIKFKINP